MWLNEVHLFEQSPVSAGSTIFDWHQDDEGAWTVVMLLSEIEEKFEPTKFEVAGTQKPYEYGRHPGECALFNGVLWHRSIQPQCKLWKLSFFFMHEGDKPVFD